MRTLLIALASLALLSSCGGGGSSEGVPNLGNRYRDFVYDVSRVAATSDLAYSTRPNMGGVQYTSSLTREEEQGQPTLTMRLDVFAPPLEAGQGARPLVIFEIGRAHV